MPLPVAVASQKHGCATPGLTLLRSLVDDGNAGRREQEGERLLKGIGRCGGQKAGHVVVVDEIRNDERIPESLHQLLEAIGHLVRRVAAGEHAPDLRIHREAEHRVEHRIRFAAQVARDLCLATVAIGGRARKSLSEGQKVVFAEPPRVGIDAVLIVQESTPELVRDVSRGIDAETVDAHLLDPVSVGILQRIDDDRVLGVEIRQVPQLIVRLLVMVAEVPNGRRPVIDVGSHVFRIQPVDHVERRLCRRRLERVGLHQVEVLRRVVRIVLAVVVEEVGRMVRDDVLDQVHAVAMQFMREPAVVIQRAEVGIDFLEVDRPVAVIAGA